VRRTCQRVSIINELDRQRELSPCLTWMFQGPGVCSIKVISGAAQVPLQSSRVNTRSQSSAQRSNGKTAKPVSIGGASWEIRSLRIPTLVFPSALGQVTSTNIHRHYRATTTRAPRRSAMSHADSARTAVPQTWVVGFVLNAGTASTDDCAVILAFGTNAAAEGSEEDSGFRVGPIAALAARDARITRVQARVTRRTASVTGRDLAGDSLAGRIAIFAIGTHGD
jgi:hypothetical protein